MWSTEKILFKIGCGHKHSIKDRKKIILEDSIFRFTQEKLLKIGGGHGHTAEHQKNNLY